MYIVASKVKKRVKELNPEITQVSRDFLSELNRKVEELIHQAAQRNGSRKTITRAELMTGSQFGIKKR